MAAVTSFENAPFVNKTTVASSVRKTAFILNSSEVSLVTKTTRFLKYFEN